jgi:hypothetical protein
MLGQMCDELVGRGLLARGDLIVLVGAAHHLESSRADLIKVQVV